MAVETGATMAWSPRNCFRTPRERFASDSQTVGGCCRNWTESPCLLSRTRTGLTGQSGTLQLSRFCDGSPAWVQARSNSPLNVGRNLSLFVPVSPSRAWFQLWRESGVSPNVATILADFARILPKFLLNPSGFTASGCKTVSLGGSDGVTRILKRLLPGQSGEPIRRCVVN